MGGGARGIPKICNGGSTGIPKMFKGGLRKIYKGGLWAYPKFVRGVYSTAVPKSYEGLYRASTGVPTICKGGSTGVPNS
jgi:hypothetical protein